MKSKKNLDQVKDSEHSIELTKKLHDRLDSYDKKKYRAKEKNCKKDLDIGKKVQVLAKRIRKKSASGKFYKQFVQNIPCFNKEQTYVIRTKQKIDEVIYYWLKNSKNNKNLIKKIQTSELFALKNNFIM